MASVQKRFKLKFRKEIKCIVLEQIVNVTMI